MGKSKFVMEIEHFNKALHQAYPPMMDALWQAMTTGDSYWADRHAAFELQYINLLTSLKADINRGLDSSGLSFNQKRQLTVLRYEMLEYGENKDLQQQMLRLWNELHNRIATFRARLNDTDLSNGQISMLLSTQKDSFSRQQVWTAGMRLGEEIAHGLINLVKMRNQVARDQGFDNYFLMKLHSQEITMEELETSIAHLRNGLDASYRKVKEELDCDRASLFGISVTCLQPWHYHMLLLQGYPVRYSSYYFDIKASIPKLAQWLQKTDLGFLLSQMDLSERSGKDQANCCLNINRSKDIRLMCNLSADNISGLGILMHELGHAFYESGLDESLPFILRQPAHPFLSEAVALLFERLSINHKWLKELGLAGYPLMGEPIWEEELRKHLLIRLYSTIALVRFEKELYSNPTGHLNDIWWSIVEEVQCIQRPNNWDMPCWAAKAHLTTLPVYYYNYLFGEMAASQIRHTLRSQFHAEFTDQSLQWLRNRLIKPGSSQSWYTLLKDSTGMPLKASYLIEDLKME
ncbi:M3 family metallopeptidase [Paenibacillus kobensis]|uniref:M3 family metallopeptidase n=1 Tax=Paenibacillus kobensis TaxID=59841 RepID=UPI000FDC582C|nr:M3 family metallopeptidase [Paenibacillus kobensis]